MKPTPRGVLAACTILAVSLAPLPARSAPAVARPDVAVAPAVSLVQVDLADAAARDRFLALGLDLIGQKQGAWAQILAWPGDLETLRGAGFMARVLDQDVGATYARRNGLAPKATPGAPTAAVPPFGSGSFAGFYNYNEVNAYLDSIAGNDPNGVVSSVVTIGTSRQGRAIRAVRIANESQPDHSRPRVLFTGLTHAREPEGMQVLIYFMN